MDAVNNTKDILDSVNTFYQQSFSTLLALTLALFGFVGIVLPILFTFYQSRLLKQERKAIIEELKPELERLYKEQLAQMEEQYANREALNQKRMEQLELQTRCDIARAMGGIYHVQGDRQLRDGECVHAFKSYVRAGIEHLNSKNERVLVVILENLRDYCLPRLCSSNFHSSNGWKENYDTFINKVRNYEGGNGRYTDLLNEIERQLTLAQQRAGVPGEV